MPTNDEFDKQISRYDKLLKPLIVFVAIYTLVGVTIGVHQVFVTTQRVDESNQQINQNMACIVSIFAQPNRASITVDNIHKCTLVRQ